MMVAPSICFQLMERDDQIEREIHAEISKLESQFTGIIGCDVVVYAPPPPEAQSNALTNARFANQLFDVRIVLALPCYEIVIERGQNANACVHSAVEEGFNAVQVHFTEWIKNRSSVSAEDR